MFDVRKKDTSHGIYPTRLVLVLVVYIITDFFYLPYIQPAKLCVCHILHYITLNSQLMSLIYIRHLLKFKMVNMHVLSPSFLLK